MTGAHDATWINIVNQALTGIIYTLIHLASNSIYRI